MDSGAPPRADALVVIPCLDEERHIGSVIGTILRDPAADNLLVVVADGGSTDQTRAIVLQIAEKASNVRLVDNPQRIQSAGINRAARLFGEGRRWLVRMDAHADLRFRPRRCGWEAAISNFRSLRNSRSSN